MLGVEGFVVSFSALIYSRMGNRHCAKRHILVLPRSLPLDSSYFRYPLDTYKAGLRELQRVWCRSSHDVGGLEYTSRTKKSIIDRFSGT